MRFLFISLLLLLLSFFSSLMAQSAAPNEDGVYEEVEQMPLFPGCGDKADQPYADRKRCADKAMLTYVYKNIRYPEAAQKAEAEGMAVVQFVVEADGRLSNLEIVRNPGSGLGEEALAVVERMNTQNIR